MVEELGLEPGPELVELERRILAQDPGLMLHPDEPEPMPESEPVEPSPPPEAERLRRKTVSVVFCDVTGSTALGESADAEVLRALLARYFARIEAIVELHGGTVEKFIGDAVMAVFGVPVLHEDDALRACRAAIEMRERSRSSGSRAGSA